MPPPGFILGSAHWLYCCLFSLEIDTDDSVSVFPFLPPNVPSNPSLLLCISVASFFISCYCMHIFICIYICIVKYKLFSQYNATSVYVFWADRGTGQLACSSLVRTAHFGKFMAVLVLILWLVEPSCPLSSPVFTEPWVWESGLHSTALGLPVLFCGSVSVVKRSFLDEGRELLHLSVVPGKTCAGLENEWSYLLQ